MSKSNFTHIAFLFINSLSLAIAGCDILKSDQSFPDDPHVDRSFVTGQRCEAPCWYELRLGKSTVDDIRATLTQLQFIDQSTLFEWPIDTEGSQLGFYFDCAYYSPPGSCGELVAKNGILVQVFMTVQYPLTLESVIEKLSVPNFFTVDTSSTESNCILSIYWPEKNIVIIVEEDSRKKHCSANKNEPIDLNLQVISLIYMNIDAQQQNYESLPWPK